MPKAIQAQNTFESGFSLNIRQLYYFYVQFMNSFVQEPGGTEVLDSHQFFQYT